MSGIDLEHRPGAGGKRTHAGVRALYGRVPAPTCANTTAFPTPATLVKATAAFVCLINAERTKRGIPALRVSSQLRQAALAHSKDMVARKYFSHTSPGGATPRLRVRRTGSLRKGKRGRLNETLVLGAGVDASPERLAKKLMGQHDAHGQLRQPLTSRRRRAARSDGVQTGGQVLILAASPFGGG